MECCDRYNGWAGRGSNKLAWRYAIYIISTVNIVQLHVLLAENVNVSRFNDSGCGLPSIVLPWVGM